ncbi:phosphoenolpyruvate--protein phosphotransferase [Nigerium massiliense]|uniref:phosphoenolpyruvate--protein phosphotransferase n=1 Tax=Nigerium massiliense TaxID=1522317 RepID=UPI00058AD94C|nr:phosphoenolpyruvate--protein phosphotransferase [Nigerium massiliense]
MENIDQTVHGTGVVSGFAYAPAGWARPRPVLPPRLQERQVPEEQREAEVERFKGATAVVANRFTERASAATGVAAEVLGATASLAKDRGWLRAAQKLINQGSTAEAATEAATEQFVQMFQQVGGLMAERVTDLRDICDRTVAQLMGEPEPGVPQPTSPIVLMADDLAPADTAGLDPEFVRALVTRLGGPTSHTAIIARQLGIPCVVAVSELGKIPESTPVLVDGTLGTVTVGVAAEEGQRLVESDAARREAIRTWRGPAHTSDGAEVDLLANVQDGPAAVKASQSQAGGIGLFRTELCFLTAQTEPSLTEQAGIYAQVLGAFPGKKVVVRTLDAGSDKPVPFANHDEEENPALGVRGIRLEKSNPGLIMRQLDAIAAAAEDVGSQTTWVMAPMVATLDEARDFAAACRERDLKPGIMVEVPAVALLADQFLAEVDFFSIGTNDLTQYTMAADRMSSPLATLTDPWQPAVLRLIQQAGQAGQRTGKPVGVCGEAAADPLLACVLLGLGVTSLSMATTAIPAVGVQVGSVSMEQCRQAAEQVLACGSAAEAKAKAAELLTA